MKVAVVAADVADVVSLSWREQRGKSDYSGIA